MKISIMFMRASSVLFLYIVLVGYLDGEELYSNEFDVLSSGISMKSCFVLFNVHSLLSFLLVWRVSHPRSISSFVTVPFNHKSNFIVAQNVYLFVNILAIAGHPTTIHV